MTDMAFLSFDPDVEKKTKMLAHARRYLHSVEKTASGKVCKFGENSYVGSESYL